MPAVGAAVVPATAMLGRAPAPLAPTLGAGLPLGAAAKPPEDWGRFELHPSSNAEVKAQF
jgi:hypothetical protein